MKTLLGLFSYGGVEEATVDSVLSELTHASANKKQVGYHRISGDALISRSRSRALGKFMDSDADVIVMIDHDITWRPGDMTHIAEEAYNKKALVGGLYCKRAFGKGWSSRVPTNGEVKFGQPGLIETPALATGFLAIPRSVVEGIDEQLDITRIKWNEDFQRATDKGDCAELANLQDLSIAPISDGAYRKVDFNYKDYFRCIRAPSNRENVYQFLSEDWSFSIRAVNCGFKSYISTYPILGHTGNYTYRVSDGMDDQDKALNNGKKQDDRPANNPNQGAGGNPSDVHDKRSDSRRNRPKPLRANRKAGKRKRK